MVRIDGNMHVLPAAAGGAAVAAQVPGTVTVCIMVIVDIICERPVNNREFTRRTGSSHTVCMTVMVCITVVVIVCAIPAGSVMVS